MEFECQTKIICCLVLTLQFLFLVGILRLHAVTCLDNPISGQWIQFIIELIIPVILAFIPLSQHLAVMSNLKS